MFMKLFVEMNEVIVVVMIINKLYLGFKIPATIYFIIV